MAAAHCAMARHSMRAAARGNRRPAAGSSQTRGMKMQSEPEGGTGVFPIE
jgi:hypothetical protein